ncbi:citrate:proton symporter [Pseudoclavibacter sp. RFBG4]|uniref:CitMHS family transporter n=1 Tax=unclassified Pseudoclavibacter TaxID=2615177 RepID=UPI000CE728AB|nr:MULTISPECIES: SLC13 family permease [unclassified Pseudoclavibacter]MBF4551493.1 citrate:proton symporter [Pseudoclavibacter sp. VKM Ac-2888]PPF37099.1 citrate:proton symporter [Pseudoclavibacter sp. AY1H1]PPF78520.1 citrate:proton symporter [Pseudoclavibacter sp. Z016]PPG26795.1 citrate:proton symporter [Pseudoclavibacter sp. RFBG4]
MLVVLGFLMIAVFMYLVMSKRATPIATLILVPLIFGAFTGAGLGMGDMVIESLLKLAPTAALLFFAIIFFGTMIDVGLFDPLIRLILRFVKDDPVRLVIGTALLTSIVSLDGDGSTTFIIVTSAFLPLYLRLGLSPVVLTVVAALSNGVLNTVPWGGSTARAAAALGVSPIDIFVPMAPAIFAGVVTVLVLAYFLGRSERKRIGRLSLPGEGGGVSPSVDKNSSRQLVHSIAAAEGMPKTGSSVVIENDFAREVTETGTIQTRPNARPRLIWFNLVLTLAVMTLLVMDVVEPAVIFMAAAGIALVVNFPKIKEQSAQIKAHADSVISVVGMVFAASVLTGIMNGTGMITEMAAWLVSIIPDWMGSFMPVIAGLLSIPLTFIMTNDAFYFGVLPILAETASHYGIAPVEMARAGLVGQALHQSSPLVASFLLLIGLANVNLGDHFKKVIVRGILVALVMLIVGGLIGAYQLF